MFEPYEPNRERQHLEIEIRGATKFDIGDLVSISMDRDPGDANIMRSGFNSYLVDTRESILRVAVVNGRIVGFGKAKNYHSEKTTYPGWYLTGLVVLPGYRNAGIGTQLTTVRLDEISRHAGEVYYFANASNRVSIELHQKLGFELAQDHFEFPGVTFGISYGILFRKELG